MGPRNRPRFQRPKQRRNSPPQAASLGSAAAPLVVEKPRPVVYGKPFLVLEDSHKKVFVIQGAQLVPHDKSIAAYRSDSQVTEMAQKIKGLTRYEIRAPLDDHDA